MKKIMRWFKRRRASSIPVVEPWAHPDIPLEVRKRLVQWLDNPDTHLALSIIQTGRPSMFHAGGGHIDGGVEVYRERTVAWFNMVRGWDAFYRALQGLRFEKPRYVEPRETFPENEDAI